jgi:hypothetical protein
MYIKLDSYYNMQKDPLCSRNREEGDITYHVDKVDLYHNIY